MKMIATRPAAQGLNSPAGKKVPTTPKSIPKAASSKIVKTEPEAPSTTTPSKKKSPETKKIDPKPATSSSSKKLEIIEGNGEAQLPWVDKYKPTNLKQVIGKSNKNQFKNYYYY